MELEAFLRNKIFIHEEKYARCYYLHVFAFDAYSNTPHEGTNAGAKYSEKRVMPNMSQTESTKMLTLQDAERNKNKAKRIADSIYKTPLHSSTSTVGRIQKQAESQLQTEMQMAENYISIRVSENKWHVLYAADRNVPRGPKPVFDRVREVTITASGHMVCSCGYTSRFGIPDRHMGHVVAHYSDGKFEWSHHDVALRHHNLFCHLIAAKLPTEMNESELSMRSKLLKLQDLHIQVPNAPPMSAYTSNSFAIGEKCENRADWNHSQVKASIEQVQKARVQALNYTAAQVEEALETEGLCENAAGLTQSQYLCDESNDGIDFDWDPSQQEKPNQPTSAYAEVAPVMREFEQALVNATAADRKKHLHDIVIRTNELNEKQRKRQGDPTGQLVSAKLQRTNPRSRHEKQR